MAMAIITNRNKTDKNKRASSWNLTQQSVTSTQEGNGQREEDRIKVPPGSMAVMAVLARHAGRSVRPGKGHDGRDGR